MFSGQLQSGARFNSVDTIGAPTLLGFWSAECSDCQQQLAAVQSWYAAEPEGAGVNVVGIIKGTAEPGSKSPIDGVEASFPVVYDPRGELFQLFGVTGVPHYCLIDEEGAIVHDIAGSISDMSDIRDLLMELQTE